MNKISGGIPMQSEGQGELLVLLKEAQHKFGYIPRELMVELAKSLDIAISDVYGVATFYSFLSTKPQGRYVIRICQSLPCFLRNCQTIIKTVEVEIGIQPSETTPDGKFSFQLTNCIGVCDRAPAMMINNDVYVELTPREISRILKTYK